MLALYYRENIVDILEYSKEKYKRYWTIFILYPALYSKYVEFIMIDRVLFSDISEHVSQHTCKLL